MIALNVRTAIMEKIDICTTADSLENAETVVTALRGERSAVATRATVPAFLGRQQSYDGCAVIV